MTSTFRDNAPIVTYGAFPFQQFIFESSAGSSGMTAEEYQLVVETFARAHPDPLILKTANEHK